jgi:hypothetical protein
MKIRVAIKARRRHKSESSTETVPQLIRYFMNEDRAGKNAAGSALGADVAHPGLLKRFFKAAKAADYEPKLLVLSGYKGTVNDSMPVALQETPAVAITHAVVQLGKMIVDLCHKRMGEHYGLPQTYVISRIPEQWKSIQDVTNFANMTQEDVKHMQQNAAPVRHLVHNDPNAGRHLEWAPV